MALESQDVTVWRGNANTLRIPIFADDGTALDLTGTNADWHLARNALDVLELMLLSKTTRDGGTIHIAQGETANNPAGQPVSDVDVVVIPIDPEDTVDLLAGTYYHTLWITDLDGNPITTTTGNFIIIPTVGL